MTELRGLLDQARKAFDDRDWSKTIDLLIEIIKREATYPGAYELLVEAQKCQKAKPKYEKGLDHYEKRNWAKAIEEFEAALCDDPGHRDARVKLEEAKEREEIDRLSGLAAKYRRNSEWKQAVETLQTLVNLLESSDLGLDLDSVRQQRDAAKEEYELACLYQYGEQYFSRKEWRAAMQSFEEVDRRRPGYRDVVKKLEMTREQHKLEGLYVQAQGYEREKKPKWTEALELYDQIYDRDHSYRDVADRIADCNKHLKDPDTRPTVPPFVWPLLGFALALGAILFWGKPLHCWLAYRVTDADVGLFMLFAGGIGAAGAILIPTGMKRVLLCIYGGVALVLLLDMLWARFLSPPPEEECLLAKATPILAEPTSTLKSTPSSTPTTLSTPSPTLTIKPNPGLELLSPVQGEVFSSGVPVKLEWKWINELGEEEDFEVRIRLKGEQTFKQVALTPETSHYISTADLGGSGVYEWQIAIILSSGKEKVLSQIGSFEVH